jgi:Mg2+ and Co2+ transporter CorA
MLQNCNSVINPHDVAVITDAKTDHYLKVGDDELYYLIEDEITYNFAPYI